MGVHHGGSDLGRKVWHTSTEDQTGVGIHRDGTSAGGERGKLLGDAWCRCGGFLWTARETPSIGFGVPKSLQSDSVPLKLGCFREG